MIELVVSLALFSVAVLVVLNLLSIGINAQRKVLALQGVQENARFILEFMTKEIRMSTISVSSSSVLEIIRPGGDRIRYSFTNGNIQRITVANNQGGPINSANIVISGGFYSAGIGAGDNFQPKITISLNVQGRGTKIEEQARIDLQTTLSQRTLDIP